MTKTNVLWIRGAILTLIAVISFSCAHGNPEKKETTVTTADREKIMEKYSSGVRESRKYIVARVNGADITLFSLINRMNKIAPTLLSTHERSPGIDNQVKQDALDILIFRELAIQEALRRGMKTKPEQVDEELGKIRAKVGSEDAFRKFIDTAGETEETLRKDIERNLLFDMIAEQEIFSRAKKGRDKDMSVELRRIEWERELKKDAKIEITLDEVEKRLTEEAGKNNRP